MNPRRIPSKFLAGLACVPLLLSAGCGSDAANPSAAIPPRSVRLARPARGAITRTVVLPATVRAHQEAVLYAKVGGYLKTILVDKGDAVAAGAVLATLEMPELQADLARNLAETDEAERDFRRQAEAHAKAPSLVVQKTVDEARARFAVARANTERIRALLDYATVTAPFAGIVSRRWADPGAFIPAATSTSTPQGAAIVTLTDLSRVRVQVAVPESEVRFVVTGAPAMFTVEALPGREFRGTVTRHSGVLDEASKTMLAEIGFDNADGVLRPGMYASVRLEVERRNDALLVPVEALLREKARASVFTVVDGRARKVPVTTGFSDAARVEIVDGVAADASVILLAGQPMADNQPVVVAEAP